MEAPYLIVGGGMAGHAAALSLRAQDPARPIVMIGAEPSGPYKRPPLSKGLWRDEPLETVWLDARIPGLELHPGRRVSAIRRAERKVVDDRGTEYPYHKLLLATGGSPRRLPFGGDRVTYFRTLEDYRRLRAAADAKARLVVVGGGFIGSEIAAALAMNGLEPVLVFPEESIGARVFPADLGQHLDATFREKGVRVLAREKVVGLERRGARTAVLTAGGAALEADSVVAGLGIVPSTELAEGAGLRVDNGIVVDQGLRTSDPSIFAAGDVARFPSPHLGTTIRVEHEDAAVTMGTAAGAAMAGAGGTYGHLPFFYSDLFDLGYEAVGLTDSRLEVVSDWTEPYRRGFLYYLADGRVRGVVCWGVFGKLREARALIAEPGPFRAGDLRGRIAP